MRAVPVIIFARFPAFPRVFKAILETLVLFRLRHMHEEFDDGDAIVLLLRFEFVDFVVSALPVFFAAKALDAFDEHAAIPGAVKHIDFACTRQAFPEPPEEMADALFLGRRGNRPDFIISRVPAGREPLDHPALAARVPALDRDDRAAPVDNMRDLNFLEPRLQLGKVGVIIARIILAVFEIFEVDGHRGPLQDGRSSTRRLSSRNCFGVAGAGAFIIRSSAF